jgi:1,4-alpha-glucan branching enzyme
MSTSAQNTSAVHGIAFTLFAPYNEMVALIGTFNNWQPTPMTKDDKGWWQIMLPLADGVYEYKFQVKSLSFFQVGQTIEVTDPRAVALTRDEKENARLTVKNGQQVITSYQWQNDDKPLPANDSLVIYEMHVGDFTGGPGDETPGKNKNSAPKGTFQAVIEKLDYLVSLGINAIELMPCNEFPGERSWGYNPTSIFAVENNYGTPDDLCQLIDECHGRGIRVIHDGVYNHSVETAPLTKIDYTYWYYKDNPDEPGNRFGPKYDYEHHDENLGIWPARQHVRDAILFWIDQFHIDGVRFDATYLIKHFDFLSWLHQEIFQHITYKPFYTIAENIPEDPHVAGPNGPLDAAWHENLMQEVVATTLGLEYDGREPFNVGALMTLLDPRNDGFSGAFNVVNYIDNHDHERIMNLLGEIAYIFGDPAFRRVKLGASLLLTAPGTPMLWMGQEWGEAIPKTTDWERISWALLQNPANADLQRYYSGLITLRKHSRALQSNTIAPVFADAERALIAFKRWDDGGGIVVVLANLKDTYAGEVRIENWPGDGQWHEYHNNYDIEVSGGVLTDSLAESEIKIYIKS